MCIVKVKLLSHYKKKQLNYTCVGYCSTLDLVRERSLNTVFLLFAWLQADALGYSKPLSHWTKPFSDFYSGYRLLYNSCAFTRERPGRCPRKVEWISILCSAVGVGRDALIRLIVHYHNNGTTSRAIDNFLNLLYWIVTGYTSRCSEPRTALSEHRTWRAPINYIRLWWWNVVLSYLLFVLCVRWLLLNSKYISIIPPW